MEHRAAFWDAGNVDILSVTKQIHLCVKMNGADLTVGASGQDGGVGRHTAPPRTTKRKTTTI